MQTKLIEKKEVAKGTMSFRFEKPEGFAFKAGQSIDLFLIDPPETDAEGNKRAYSMAGAPYEDMLMIATRMRDTAFKRVLGNLPIGSELTLEGPFGSMTLHNDVSKAAVFLAGGIGITPFHSMDLQAAHDELPHKIYLFYSNHTPADAPFLEELKRLEEQNPNYKFIATMTDDEAWTGEKSRINKEMLEKYVIEGLSNPIYYIAGPPAMVAGLKKMLNDAGVNDDYIKFEEFEGY